MRSDAEEGCGNAPLNVANCCQKKDKWGESGLIYFLGKASLHYIILSFLLLGWETPVRKWQMVGNNKRKEMSSFKKEILHFLSLVASAGGIVTGLCNSLVSFWACNVKTEIIASVAEFQMSLVFKKEEKKIAHIKNLFLKHDCFAKRLGAINTGPQADTVFSLFCRRYLASCHHLDSHYSFCLLTGGFVQNVPEENSRYLVCFLCGGKKINVLLVIKRSLGSF